MDSRTIYSKDFPVGRRVSWSSFFRKILLFWLQNSSIQLRSGRYGKFQWGRWSSSRNLAFVTLALWTLQLSRKSVSCSGHFAFSSVMNCIKSSFLMDLSLIRKWISPSLWSIAATTAIHFPFTICFTLMLQYYWLQADCLYDLALWMLSSRNSRRRRLFSSVWVLM